MDIRSLAQQAKHSAFVGTKRTHIVVKEVGFKFYDVSSSRFNSPGQYKFNKARYRRSFLNRDLLGSAQNDQPIPRIIYCFWTGNNEMSDARLRSLATIQSTLKNVKLQVITPDNLADFIVADHPLHKAYEYLSLVHRSDYLRAYFMHYYGGGYLDLKRISNDWSAAFEQLDRSPEKWALGYGESTSRDVARLSGALGRDLRKFHRILIGNGAYIFRKGTPFTAEWLAEQERRLDYFYPQAVEFPGEVRGDVVGYPLSWQDLLGRVFHPLCLKYADRLIINNQIRPEFTDYL